MDGFIERIERPSVIVRVGAGAKGKPDKWERAVFGEVIAPDRVVLKAYDQPLSAAIFTAIMVTLHHNGFRFAEFERMGPPRRTITVALSDKGAERMTWRYHAD